MTDEPTDDLEQRLRRDLGEIADAVPVSESPSAATNVVPITAASERRRRPVLAVAGVVGAAAALLIGVLIWQSDDDGPGEDVATQDPTTVPATTEAPQSTTVPASTTAPTTTFPRVGPTAGCPVLPSWAGATVQGETLNPAVQLAAPPEQSASFGADEGGDETYAASETYQVAAALPVRPVIDFVGERTAQEGPVLLWWAADDRVEAWVSADGCDTVGLSVTGGARDRNAQAAAELAFLVAREAGLDAIDEPATDCPQPQAESGGSLMLFFYCPFDDVDQIPRPIAPRDPFLETPEEALQALFDTTPPQGWGTGIPLVLRGADVGLAVTDGVARLEVDYDFEAAPIGNFSASAWALAYGNQLQATLFQFPEIEAIDFDTICCGEWGGGDPGTRDEWETWLAQATES